MRVHYLHKKPKVSVIMTVYNGEKYLKCSVMSILNQTFQDFEFIIINDGSTDRTKEILDSFSDPRMKIYHEKHEGRPRSLNKAVRRAKGKYIANLDCDDVSLPGRLEKEVEFLNKNPEIGLVGAAIRVHIDENGKIINIKEAIFPTQDNKLKALLSFRNSIFHSSVMIRKNVFRKVGLYNEFLNCFVDYDLWVRLAKHYKIANLPHLLTYKRWHSTQFFSKAIHKESKSYKIQAKIKYRAYKLYGGPKKALVNSFLIFCKSFLIKNFFARSIGKRMNFSYTIKKITVKIFKGKK